MEKDELKTIQKTLQIKIVFFGKENYESTNMNLENKSILDSIDVIKNTIIDKDFFYANITSEYGLYSLYSDYLTYLYKYYPKGNIERIIYNSI